jgi:hypothetical protein
MDKSKQRFGHCQIWGLGLRFNHNEEKKLKRRERPTRACEKLSRISKQVRKQNSKSPSTPSSAEALQKRIAVAKLTPFPGDLPLDNDALNREGLLVAVQRLERELARHVPFNELDGGLSGLPIAVKRRIYRWLCLLYEQNRLLTAEATILRTRLLNADRTTFELRDELSEGMWGFVNHLRDLGKTTHEVCAELLPLVDRIRADYRERNKSKEEEKTKRSSQTYERRRKRSGLAPLISQDIDWTQPHTEQEYVDAFADKFIHAKRVREFLRPLPTEM